MSQIIITGLPIVLVMGAITFFYFRQNEDDIRGLFIFQTLPFLVFPFLFFILLDLNGLALVPTIDRSIEGLMLFCILVTTPFIFAMAVGGFVKGIRHHKKVMWIFSALLVPLFFIPYMVAALATIPLVLLTWKAVDRMRPGRKKSLKKLV